MEINVILVVIQSFSNFYNMLIYIIHIKKLSILDEKNAVLSHETLRS